MRDGAFQDGRRELDAVSAFLLNLDRTNDGAGSAHHGIARVGNRLFEFVV
jgi:hypothetical protein